MKRIGHILLTALSAVYVFSCQDKEPDIIPVEAVTMSQSTAEMVIGDHIQLKALITPSNSTDNEIIWSSSNNRVATVTDKGFVEALAKGTTNISALVGGLTGTCRVSVSEVSIESLTLNKQSLQLYIGQSETLIATIKPEYTTDKTVIWFSSDPTVATVENGVVTGKKTGEATIKAKSGDITAECIVLVSTKAVESIILNKQSLKILEGESEQLVAEVLPMDATNKTVSWSSSNNNVASVSQEGIVTGISLGYASITASCEDKTAICKVSVEWQQVESVALNKSELKLLVGDSEKLIATLLPENCTFKDVDWRSTNELIASVDYNGNVYALSAGITTISANCFIRDSRFGIVDVVSASCEVTVTEIPAESITLNKTSLSLNPGDSFQLEATVKPDNVSNRTISWTSSNPSAISVSSSGLVQALDCGKATISVYCGGITVYCQVTVSDTDGLCLEAIETGNVEIKNPLRRTIQYSYDGSEWQQDSRTAFSLALNSGETMYLRGTSSSYGDSYSYTNIICHGKCYVYGNIMSLISTNYRTIYALSNSYAFKKLFADNTNIVNHPQKKLLLPAESLSSYCYQGMFSGCVGINSAPDLPATNLAANCYQDMFSGCTGLKNAPQLPANTLAQNCYAGMFRGCTSLTEMPELNASILSYGCYDGMFEGCLALTTIHNLPALTLSDYCYRDLFKNCTSLTKAPSLPATTLANYCYVNMFAGCTSLETAPVLPATTLASCCYEGMFMNCTNLVTAPELPALYVDWHSYQYMFKGCSKLNYIKALFTSFYSGSPSYCLSQWVSGVSSNGTFVTTSSGRSILWTGIDGIPSGWTVETINE